jgi:hypothetical protein
MHARTSFPRSPLFGHPTRAPLADFPQYNGDTMSNAKRATATLVEFPDTYLQLLEIYFY